MGCKIVAKFFFSIVKIRRKNKHERSLLVCRFFTVLSRFKKNCRKVASACTEDTEICTTGTVFVPFDSAV